MSLLRTLPGTVSNPIAIHDSRFTIPDSRFPIPDSQYGGEQEKRPCGLFNAAHLLVQDREKGGNDPVDEGDLLKSAMGSEFQFELVKLQVLNWQSPIAIGNISELPFVNLAAMVYISAVVPLSPKNDYSGGFPLVTT